jgi:hypothetical protein
MKTIYTVYQLNEKRNKLGNPYIGFTQDLVKRAKAWKNTLKLDYVPELIELYTDTSRQRAFDWEQDRRVKNGWKRERSLRHLVNITKKANVAASKSEKIKQHAKKIGKKLAGELGKKWGKIHVESGHLQNISSLAGKVSCSKIRTCPYCNKTIKGINYNKWHGDRCKSKPTIDNTL